MSLKMVGWSTLKVLEFDPEKAAQALCYSSEILTNLRQLVSHLMSAESDVLMQL